MKVLIIGSEGFVGQNLVNGLKDQFEIFTADMPKNGSYSRYTQLDIIDKSAVESVVKNVDVVINLAAHSLISSLDGIIPNAEINILGLLNVLEACRKNQIKKIVFTSASSLVGIPSMEKVSEIHSAKPQTAYGITKLASEHYIRLYQELHQIDYVIFRFFNIYGPFQKNGVIPAFYNRIKSNDPITIFGEGNQIRDYVFIEDVIPFFISAISSSKAHNSIFNLGTGKGTSIKEIVDIMAKLTGIEPKIDIKDPRPGEIGNFVSDTSLLAKTFDSIPSTDVTTGLKNTISWLEQHS